MTGPSDNRYNPVFHSRCQSNLKRLILVINRPLSFSFRFQEDQEVQKIQVIMIIITIIKGKETFTKPQFTSAAEFLTLSLFCPHHIKNEHKVRTLDPYTTTRKDQNKPSPCTSSAAAANLHQADEDVTDKANPECCSWKVTQVVLPNCFVFL